MKLSTYGNSWRVLFPGDSQVQEEIASILAEEGATEAALDRYTGLGTVS